MDDVQQAYQKDVYRHLEALAKRIYKLENPREGGTYPSPLPFTKEEDDLRGYSIYEPAEKGWKRHPATTGDLRLHPTWERLRSSAEEGDIVAIDPLTGANATLTNFSTDPKDYPATTADLDQRDHFASEVRALHPTQLDKIESKLDDLMVQVNEVLRQLDTGA